MFLILMQLLFNSKISTCKILIVLEFILHVLNSINFIFYDHKIDGYAMVLICI
jgi:hypothetical protein